MQGFESVPAAPRVLIVDDHAEWRQQISSLLRQSRAWAIVGEAADGPEAVAMAAALTPDLILLDLEMPTMNGIAAAKQILAADPSSRILFLSGHRSWDVLETVLTHGARGYVLKMHAATELLPAMTAVADGRRFVSAALGGRPVVVGGGVQVTHDHAVTFPPDDAALTDEYERFAAAALAAGLPVICVAARERREDLARRLRMRGIDIDAATADDRYIAVDVADVVQPLMVNGLPDERLFWKAAIVLGIRALRASSHKSPLVAAFGDASPSLWQAGQIDAAIRLEQLWDEFARTFNVDILCGYPLHDEGQPGADAHAHLCAAHSVTYGR